MPSGAKRTRMLRHIVTLVVLSATACASPSGEDEGVLADPELTRSAWQEGLPDGAFTWSAPDAKAQCGYRTCIATPEGRHCWSDSEVRYTSVTLRRDETGALSVEKKLDAAGGAFAGPVASDGSFGDALSGVSGAVSGRTVELRTRQHDTSGGGTTTGGCHAIFTL
jgi:hypothetical protein